MAYYLAFDGVNDYVSIPQTAESGTLIYDLDLSNSADKSDRLHIRLNNDTNGRPAWYINYTKIGNDVTLQSLVADVTTVDFADVVVSGRFTIKIKGDGNTGKLISMWINGSQVITDASVFDSRINITRIIANASSSVSDIAVDLHGLEVWDYDETTLIRNYDPSASNGTGLILPDTVGANDGTLVNFPTDNSQWVFYASGATYTITLDAGSYTYTGSAVTLAANRNITLDSGTFTYTGSAVDLAASRNITIEPGSYTYTGEPVALRASRNITLDAGTYAYTGSDVTLTYTPASGATYTITLDAGTYAITGEQVALAANRALSLGSGAYAYTGNDVALKAGRVISIDAGAFVVTGNAVQLSANRSITLEQGEYAYTGFPVDLTYSGEVIALISGYSVNYKQDEIAASYSNDYISARFL